MRGAIGRTGRWREGRTAEDRRGLEEESGRTAPAGVEGRLLVERKEERD